MPTVTRVRVEGVPDAAMAAFKAAADRSGESQTNVINWCLSMLSRSYPRSQFYWAPGDGGALVRISEEPLASGGSRTDLTVNLLSLALQGLSNSRSRFRCEDDGVLARVAHLAVYYDRRDGQLGYGFVAGNAVIGVSHLHMVRTS
jgi:hypothetical protein